MKAPAWYDQWRDDSYDALADKHNGLKQTYGLGHRGSWNYDMNEGRLTFSDGGPPQVRADMQVVGTVGPEDWLWGWANASLPMAIVEDVGRVRAFGLEHDIDELTTECLEDGDLNNLGWMMTVVAAKILDAPGGYRTQTGIFFVYRSIERVN